MINPIFLNIYVLKGQVLLIFNYGLKLLLLNYKELLFILFFCFFFVFSKKKIFNLYIKSYLKSNNFVKLLLDTLRYVIYFNEDKGFKVIKLL